MPSRRAELFYARSPRWHAAMYCRKAADEAQLCTLVQLSKECVTEGAPRPAVAPEQATDIAQACRNLRDLCLSVLRPSALPGCISGLEVVTHTVALVFDRDLASVHDAKKCRQGAAIAENWTLPPGQIDSAAHRKFCPEQRLHRHRGGRRLFTGSIPGVSAS